MNGGASSPATSSTTAPCNPGGGTPGDDIPGSTGRKRKAAGNENLVDFVKDFNHDYLAQVEAQERDKRSWRTELMALDTAREARIANKEAESSSMDNKLYDLEVERTRNLGNNASALLMLASSMDTLTRYAIQPQPTSHLFLVYIMFSYEVYLCNPSSGFEQGSPEGPPVPSFLLTMLFPCSQGPLALEGEKRPRRLAAASRPHPLVGDGTPQVFGLMCGPCLPVGCCATHNMCVQL